MIKDITGNLITLAKEGHFDVITHGCNCFCTMGAGIAPQMAEAFGCDIFPMEAPEFKGVINKLGSINYQRNLISIGEDMKLHKEELIVINSYTQYHYGKNHIDGVSTPVDYDAITMCMKKINHIFKGKTIGLPLIGAGLAGGDWNRIKRIIEKELTDMEVIIVHYDKIK